MVEAAKQKEKPTLMPSGGNFALAEQVRVVYCATAEAGITFKQMLEVDYWAHVARQLKPYNMVECRSEDGTFWGLVLVMEVGRNWAKVHPLQYVALDTKDVAQTRTAMESKSEYRVEWKGPVKKHAVIRNKDDAIVHEGSASKVDAQAWLVDHLKTVDA